VLTGKLVLVIFLIVDTAYVARMMRREVRALRRRMPRWHGPELVFSECAASAAGADPHATRSRLHELLDHWLDKHVSHRALGPKRSDLQPPHNRDAA
jgi:hypothetical protein